MNHNIENQMVRKIRLYGALEKAAGKKELMLAADTTQQVITALRWQSPTLDMTLRSKPIMMCYTENDDEVDPHPIGPDFHLSEKAKVIHVAQNAEGAWNFVIQAIVMIVIAAVTAYVSASLMKMLNKQGQGGYRSTMFNGPVNSTDQGGPIPIVYGLKTLVGSTIISAMEEYSNVI